MAQHTVNLDLGAALAPPRTCPACGSADLTSVIDADGISFECVRCERTWIPVMGILVSSSENTA